MQEEAHALKQFEWHDLPVESLSFEENAVRIAVTPFCEKKQDYDRYELLITDASKLNISMKGEISFATLSDLEVSYLDFTNQEDLISGEIGILPGNEGFWKIGFLEAKWNLTQKSITSHER